MTDEVMSPTAFKWFMTALTGVFAALWVIYDSFNLIRLLSNKSLDTSDAVYRDKRFGYVMGIVIGAVGVWGVLRFHNVV